MNEYHYEILRLLKILPYPQTWAKFWHNANAQSLIIDDLNKFTIALKQLEQHKLIYLDKATGIYALYDMGTKALDKYEKQKKAEKKE